MARALSDDLLSLVLLASSEVLSARQAAARLGGRIDCDPVDRPGTAG